MRTLMRSYGIAGPDRGILHSVRRQASALLALAAVGSLGVAGHAQPAVFSDKAPAVAVTAQGTNPAIARIRYVSVDASTLAQSSSVTLNLFNDTQFVATRQKLQSRGRGHFTWYGDIVGKEFGKATLVVDDGRLSGSVTMPFGKYQLRPLATSGANSRVSSLVQLNESAYGDCSTPNVEKKPFKLQAPPAAANGVADDGTQIDVMVVYTAQAAAADPNLLTTIQAGFDDANQAYANSGVTQRLRLVHTEQVTYTESGDLQVDRDRLQDPADGIMDNVHALRDTYKADLVSLWVSNSNDGNCGIAYIMDPVSVSFAPYGFCVVRTDCAVDNHSFAHELGHIMGARHDRYADPTENSPYAYNHGYSYLPGGWRTIMAYNNECAASSINCTRIQVFSTPDYTYGGIPIGVAEGQPNPTNNAKTLNNTAFTIANFRSSGGTIVRPPNDNFANAITINAATMNGSNVNGTKQTGEPSHAGNAGGESVWWKWTAPSSGTVSFTTTGSNFDTLLAVYTGTSVSALTEKASNDDGAAGTTSEVFEVPVVGGTTYYVAVDGYNGASGIAEGAVVLNYSFVGTNLPNLRINDVSIAEGNTGTKTATFTVTLSAAVTSAVTVNYATANGTSSPATAGSDYVAKTGTLTFAAGGALTQSVAVTINGDTTVEPNETFFVNLTNPSGATLADAQGLGTITNDDSTTPTLSINDVSIAEGNTGTKTATFTVSLSAAVTSTVTLNYATANGTGSPATAGSDYVAKTGTLTFAAGGALTQTVVVTINGDTTVEPDETFFVNLTSPVGATLADAQGLGTITNDDSTGGAFVVSISDVQMREGDANNRSMYFTVSLNKAATSTITVTATTSGAPGVSNPATPTTDFTNINTGVTFAVGQTAVSVGVPIVGDTSPEADENFAVSLVSPTGATIGKAVGVGTIINDDGAGAAYLTNVALAPEIVTSSVGAVQKFITTQRDSTGQANISESRILLDVLATPSLYVRYDAVGNKLYLRNDANSAWLGGFAPGTANVITNTKGSLDCSGVQVIRNGNDLVIVWALIPKAGLVGAHDVKIYAQNKAGLLANFEKKGTWMVQ